MRIVGCAFDFKIEEPKLCWVITQKCNLACAHCCSNSSPVQNTSIDIDKGESFLEQAASLGIKRIIFTGGEPLLNTELSKLVRLAESLGMTPSLSTNATLIDTDVAHSLFDMGIRKATVSLDGNQEQHDGLRRRKGAFAATVAGATALSVAGVRVTLNCLLRAEIINNVHELYEMAAKVGAPEVTFTFPLYAGRMGQMSDVYSNTWKSAQQFIEIITKTALNWEDRIETTIFQPLCGTPLCPAGKSVFGAVDNRISSCVYDSYPVTITGIASLRPKLKREIDSS